MRTDAALILAQWFSPAYPLGAFAYSHGLEVALAEGSVADGPALQRWVAAVLEHGSGRNDAILAAAAFRAAPERLDELDALAAALAVGAERLHETRTLGAAFARTTAAVWDLDLPPLCYPVAVGRAARLLGLPLPAVLRHLLAAFAAALVSAGVRLIPLGQTEGQRITQALHPLVERLAAEAEPGDTGDLGGAALLADIQSLRHETLEQRTFRT